MIKNTANRQKQKKKTMQYSTRNNKYNTGGKKRD